MNRRIISLLSIFFLIACSLQAQPSVWAKSDKANLEDSIWLAMNRHEIPGAQVVMFSKRKIIFDFSGGVTNIQSLEKVNSKTIFETASLSKPVFHFLLHRLVEKGKLPPTFFQDTLTKYIDTLRPMKESEIQHVKGLTQYLQFNKNYPEAWFKTLTVKQLLNHTGGLGDWMAPAPSYNIYPGERFDYCDDCYILLQRVVEHYLEEPLQSLANTYLPKQCKGVSQFAWNNKQTNYAFGHFASMDLMRDIWKTTEGVAHGTLASSATGYAKFVQYIAQKQLWGQTTDTVFVANGLYWQPGWGVEMTDSGPQYWHWGNDGCYQHVVYYNPANDLGLVILTNSEFGLKFSQAIANRVFGHKLKSMSWLLGN